MTALDKYLRLESTGLWTDGHENRKREVLVSFGNATLVLSDFNDLPLAHWALAATSRISMDAGTAVYTPDSRGFETLEIADPLMIEAIAQVSRLQPAPPPRRKTGRWIAAAVVLAATASAYYTAPAALRTQAVRMTTQDSARQIGRNMLDVAGIEVCREPAGDAARETLVQRLFPQGEIQVLFAQNAPDGTLFPGGIVVIGAPALMRMETPEMLAGWIREIAKKPPPVAEIITQSSLPDVITYLSSGTLPTSRLSSAAAGVLASAVTLDAASEAPTVSPVLREPDWRALRKICLQ